MLEQPSQGSLTGKGRQEMSDRAADALSVSIRELPSIHAAYVEHIPNGERGDLHDEIGRCFQRVQAWVRQLGHDPLAGWTIGVIRTVNGQLASYDCCVQVPDAAQSGSDGIQIQELPGGRYAVVSMRKDPAVIGDGIRRFYEEYVPQNHIEIDGARPVYEIYFESTMEYCVPVGKERQ